MEIYTNFTSFGPPHELLKLSFMADFGLQIHVSQIYNVKIRFNAF